MCNITGSLESLSCNDGYNRKKHYSKINIGANASIFRLFFPACILYDKIDLQMTGESVVNMDKSRE